VGKWATAQGNGAVVHFSTAQVRILTSLPKGSHLAFYRNRFALSHWGTGPVREFCQFADRLGATSSSSLQLPSNELLFRLMAVVRENSYAK
jgi:hypothetical protein